MSEMNMSEIMQNLSKMMNGKEIPDNMKVMLQNMINSNNSTTPSFGNTNSSSSATDTASSSANEHNSPTFSSSNHSQSDNNETNPFGNLDIGTIMKMKSIMEKLNSKKNDPRSNLLLSLKPYLKPSRKEKVDQYIQLFAMTDVLDSLNMVGR